MSQTMTINGEIILKRERLSLCVIPVRRVPSSGEAFKLHVVLLAGIRRVLHDGTEEQMVRGLKIDDRAVRSNICFHL